jgi:fatty acid desaturase
MSERVEGQEHEVLGGRLPSVRRENARDLLLLALVVALGLVGLAAGVGWVPAPVAIIANIVLAVLAAAKAG